MDQQDKRKKIKRSIKFDDDMFGLYLDIQIPGEDWRRIRPEEARRAGRADPSLRSGPLELSGEMIAGTARGIAAGVGEPSTEHASGSNAVRIGGRPS